MEAEASVDVTCPGARLELGSVSLWDCGRPHWAVTLGVHLSCLCLPLPLPTGRVPRKLCPPRAGKTGSVSPARPGTLGPSQSQVACGLSRGQACGEIGGERAQTSSSTCWGAGCWSILKPWPAQWALHVTWRRPVGPEAPPRPLRSHGTPSQLTNLLWAWGSGKAARTVASNHRRVQGWGRVLGGKK